MTQYLRGAFSVGAKPGESKEMDDNWERTFGKKAVSDAVLVDKALEPLRADVLKGLEANERMEQALQEVVRLARLTDEATDREGLIDTIKAVAEAGLLP